MVYSIVLLEKIHHWTIITVSIILALGIVLLALQDLRDRWNQFKK